MVFHPDWISNEQKDKIKSIINSLKPDSSLIQSLSSVVNADNWTGSFGINLLSGKFIGHVSGKIHLRKYREKITSSIMKIIFCFFFSVEKKLLVEDDLIVQARIDVLMKLFEISNSEEVTAMILNVFETYRKLLIRDTDIQNKFSSTTVEKLLNNNMIILCHRKQYEHLYSMVN